VPGSEAYVPHTFHQFGLSRAMALLFVLIILTRIVPTALLGRRTQFHNPVVPGGIVLLEHRARKGTRNGEPLRTSLL
jgi:hypothetical protein